jgi:hypothetical protein
MNREILENPSCRGRSSNDKAKTETSSITSKVAPSFSDSTNVSMRVDLREPGTPPL